MILLSTLIDLKGKVDVPYLQGMLTESMSGYLFTHKSKFDFKIIETLK